MFSNQKSWPEKRKLKLMYNNRRWNTRQRGGSWCGREWDQISPRGRNNPTKGQNLLRIQTLSKSQHYASFWEKANERGSIGHPGLVPPDIKPKHMEPGAIAEWRRYRLQMTYAKAAKTGELSTQQKGAPLRESWGLPSLACLLSCLQIIKYAQGRNRKYKWGGSKKGPKLNF